MLSYTITTSEFVTIHTQFSESNANMQAEKIDTLPNGRQLTYGEYKDSSRPLRRLLKQLGSGSMEAGMTNVITDEEAQASVSQLIGVPSQVSLCLCDTEVPCSYRGLK